MTTGKTIALIIWIFVESDFSAFNKLSRFVIALLSRSKYLLISWLQSPSEVILEPKKIRCHCFHFFPIYLPWSDLTRGLPRGTQFSSVAQSCLTLCDPMDCSTPSLPVHHQLPEFTQTHAYWVGDAIQPSHPPSSPSPPTFSLSQHKSLFSESVLLIRWPNCWSFSFNISPSSEYSGLIFFRMDWLDLFAVQGTLKSLLQHHSSKASILQCSALFIVQLSHPYTTTGKTIALTRWTFVGKVTSLLLNMLSRLVISFLPRSKCLLISWLQSPSALIWEPEE